MQKDPGLRLRVGISVRMRAEGCAAITLVVNCYANWLGVLSPCRGNQIADL